MSFKGNDKSINERPSQILVAEAAARLVEATEIDPKMIDISPIDAPQFCFEFWSRIGFNSMNDIDFCYLVDSYLKKKCFWLPVNLYLRKVNWKIIPERFLKYTRKKKVLSVSAQQQHLQLALAVILAANRVIPEKMTNDQILSVLPDGLNGVALSSLPNFTPFPSNSYEALLSNDKLSYLIRSELNFVKPLIPDFSSSSDPLYVLRQSVDYLTFALPIAKSLPNYATFLLNLIRSYSPLHSANNNANTNNNNANSESDNNNESNINNDRNSDRMIVDEKKEIDPLTYFLILRLCGLLHDAGGESLTMEMIIEILESITELTISLGNITQSSLDSVFPDFIQNELSYAYQLGQHLSFDSFLILLDYLILSCDCFKSTTSLPLSRAITPLFSFFNVWDILFKKFNDPKLFNHNNIFSWAPLTVSMSIMPFKKRQEFVSEFSTILEHSDLFLTLKPTSQEFISLVSAFPTSAMNWYVKMDKSVGNPVFEAMHDHGGTGRVFKIMARDALKMKLESTKLSENNESRKITAIYKEDEASVAVKLVLQLPAGYPFKQVSVSCEFGDEGENCAHHVAGAIIREQSIQAGILEWHKFVIARLKDAEPCTVCYSYLSEEMKKPTVACPVCGQKFHGKCLSKWFSKSLKPTCPYCASPWDEKAKKKK